ncbi:MAG: glycosyltransferase family 39 protein, partial [Chloroflexi bacterium]|nr:glycosyltransferase family 39 protein [Chloroflexota bacterium]
MTDTIESEQPEKTSVQSRDFGRKATAIGLFAVIALALLLRMYGLNWDEGFGWTPHPDERAILSKVAEISPPSLGEIGVLLDAEESPWNPRWFPYGSFPLYFLKGVELLYNVLPGADLTDLRTTGRVISGLVDVLTVVVVFGLGRMMHSRKVGLFAAGLVAMAVIHIQLSHFFAVDTFLALFAVLTMFFLVRVARHGNARDSVLAGLFMGLGLATKVSLAPIGAAYIGAHLMYAGGLLSSDTRSNILVTERISTALKNAALGGLATGVTFFIVQPYAILDWDRFYADVTEQSEMVRRIRDYPYTRQYVDTTSYLYQIRQLTTWGLGWPLGVIAWIGALYAGFRGLKFGGGVLYVIVGWALPMAVLTVSNSFLAMLVASTIAVGALLVSMPFRRTEARAEAFLLAWVAPYFFITGTFEVKFLRYMIPITPFLLLFAARLIVDLLEYGAEARRGSMAAVVRPLIAVGIALGFAATAFYSISYLGIYSGVHPAVEASEWINANAPSNSVILKEHWEEGLPNMGRYQNRELPLYEPDTPNKLRIMGEELSRADYLVFFSNRLYGTIPRLPERYPITTEYYVLLFTGQLGFQLDAHFESYPELLGVGFVDDTFSRPELPVPAALRGFEPSPVTLNMGFTDESFSVYDHPKVLIFKNVKRLAPDVISARILDASTGFPEASLPAPPAPRSSKADGKGLMLSAEDAETQQSGGTWTDIVRADSWTNRLPVVAWLLVVEGFAVLVFPIAFVVFRPLPDRGWLFAKALGLLLVGLIVWLLASLQWMAFSQASVAVAVVALFVVSLMVLARQRDAIKEFLRQHWKVVTIGEAVFIAAFLAFLVIRMANPDLWHPYRGGEKPMDFAYLNAVMKSTYMPPYDPWFGGGYINYYYWGQFLVSTLIHATGIKPDVAVNLSIPMFFALTFGAAYSLVYNLAEGTRRRLQPSIGGFHLSPILAGLAGGLFVAVLGNLDGAVQLGEGVYRSVVQGLPAGEFDFWRSSRMMPPDPPGNEITEFPFFTFLFADPHAHLMALPFTVLALGVSLAVLLGAVSRRDAGNGWGVEEVVRLVVLGVVVGSLRLLNAWDYPTYLMIAAGAVGIGEILANGGLNLAVGIKSGTKAAIVFVAGYVAFLPYHRAYETFFNSVESTTNTTALGQFLAISGVFVFIIGSYYLWELRDALGAAGRQVRVWTVSMVDTVSADADLQPAARGSAQVGAGLGLAMVGAALTLAYLATAMVSGFGGGTIIFASLIVLLIVAGGLRSLVRQGPDTAQVAFISLLVGAAFLLVVGLDFVRVEGDIDRMNSIFKFYLQVWVLMAVGS